MSVRPELRPARDPLDDVDERDLDALAEALVTLVRSAAKNQEQRASAEIDDATSGARRRPTTGPLPRGAVEPS
jgi:hypothetical protein